jgi:hypothetical protein
MRSDLGSDESTDPCSDAPLLHLAVGLAQGLAVHALWSGWCHGCALDAATLWRTALLYAAAVAPMVWHFTSGGIRSRGRRVTAAVVTGLTFGAMAAWTYGRSNLPVGWWGSPLTMPTFNLPLVALTAVVVSLLVSPCLSGRRECRGAPVDPTGRNVVLGVAALVMTGLFWVLLGASGWLMQAIGVATWPRLLGEFGVIAPVTCGAFGFAVGVVLRRPRVLEAVRTTVMQAVGWLLPVALVFLAIWAAALLYTGFQTLRQTRNAAFHLSWFAMLCIVLANAWWRGHGAATPATAGRWNRWLRSAMPWLWLLTHLLPACAGWALWVRIDQHGLTTDRVWGVAMCAVIAVCTAGYSWRDGSARRWPSAAAATNTVASLLLAALMAMLMTPLADARRLSVQNQVTRLESGAVSPEGFDWEFLTYRSDHYGREALVRLAALPQDTPLGAALAAGAARELATIAKAESSSDRKAPAPAPRP